MIAFLYPGQGEQRPGMLRSLPDDDAVSETLDRVSTVLGHDVRELDSAQRLADTVAAQVAILTAGIAVTRLVAERADIRPDAVAGHSVGAFAAAVAAGVLTVEEAVHAVLERSRGMRTLYPTGHGLLALIGARLSDVDRLVQHVRGTDDLFIAMENAVDQIVVAGSDAAFDRVAAAAAGFGVREVRRLDVAVPSHCELMSPVAAAVAELLRSFPARQPTIRYLAAMTARNARTTTDVHADLAGGVAHTVRWRDTTDLLAEFEPAVVVQVSPGHVTAALFASAHEDRAVIALDDSPLGDSLVRLTKVLAKTRG